MLRGVTRGVHRTNGDVSKGDLVTMPHPDSIEQTRGIKLFAIPPIGAALIRDVHPGTGSRGELTGTRKIVRVNMRLGDRDDPHAVVFSELQILVQVTTRVDHDRFPNSLATDEITRLCKILVVNALQQHEFLPPQLSARTDA